MRIRHLKILKYILLTVILCLSVWSVCPAAGTSADVNGDGRKKIKKKKKKIGALAKTIQILAYLNYSDRNVDRPLLGPIAFEPYKGKRINNIQIRIMYPYGIDLDSPDVYHPTRFQSFENGIQFKTRLWVIHNELLFKEGETVDPVSFADSERNLWGKNIYKDIRFVITDLDDGSIDVIVYVRDKFNWSVVSKLGYDNVKAGVQFNNVMGLPQVISGDVALNFIPKDLYTLEGAYSFSNIKSSFIDIGAAGTYDNFTKGGSINVTRNFFSAKTEWAGHVILSLFKQQYIAPELTSIPVYAPNSSNIQDFWIARAFKMPGPTGDSFPLMRLIVSTRMLRTDYMTRPYLHNSDYTVNFVDITNILIGIGIARWDYYIDHNVYALDKAEYFTNGISAAFIGGFQDNEELQRRTYLGAAFQYGKYIKNRGYLLGYLKYGGFVTPRSYDQVLVDWENTFYTIPQKLPRATMRHFLTSICKWGFSRPLGTAIIANNDNGLRGLSSTYLQGIRTYGLSYEMDFYSTKKVLGFSSSMFIFSDNSIIQKSNTDNIYQAAVGFGFRLRNLNAGIDFIQLMFAYYPRLNVPDQGPYNFLGNFVNDRTPAKRDLFGPEILNVD